MYVLSLWALYEIQPILLVKICNFSLEIELLFLQEVPLPPPHMNNAPSSIFYKK